MSEYIINGNDADIERLKILSDTYDDYTMSLLQSAGIKPGMRVLELGCGTGQLARKIAKYLVGMHGKVVAVDYSVERLIEAKEQRGNEFKNLKFKQLDVATEELPQNNDLVCARSLLCHLQRPKEILRKMINAVKTGGIVVLEEPNLSGIVHYPFNTFMEKGQQLFNSCVKIKGGDIDIGFKLPHMFYELGLINIKVSVYQPIFMRGELKCTLHHVLRNSSEVLLDKELITNKELNNLIKGIELFIQDEKNLVTRPRMFQVCGVRN